MTTTTVGRSAAATLTLPLTLVSWRDEWLGRDRRLVLYAALLLAVMVPMAIAWGLDDRVLRGVNVWVKPMKFAVSIALVALTTAWFIGHLPVARRTGKPIDRIVWILIVAGTFELGYIAVQAALGQPSHYNEKDAFHAVMYALMGIGALTLTATQPMLAWQLYKHPDLQRPAAYRTAVLVGLVLTFVFGAGVGGLLANLQPSSVGATVPLMGWSLSGGDLRPAHFVGIHAEQVLPFIGFAATALGLRHAGRVVWFAAAVWTALFGALVVWGLPA